jgi:hypothetical protein
MTGNPLSWLNSRLETMETILMKRQNVIRFLVVRLLLMLAMVIGFWAVMHNAA